MLDQSENEYYKKKYLYYKNKYKNYIGGTIECKKKKNDIARIVGDKWSGSEADALNILWDGQDGKTNDYSPCFYSNNKDGNFKNYKADNSFKTKGINVKKWWHEPERVSERKNHQLSSSPIQKPASDYFNELCPKKRKLVIDKLKQSIRIRQSREPGLLPNREYDDELLFKNNESNDPDKDYHGKVYDRSIIKSLNNFEENLYKDVPEYCNRKATPDIDLTSLMGKRTPKRVEDTLQLEWLVEELRPEINIIMSRITQDDGFISLKELLKVLKRENKDHPNIKEIRKLKPKHLNIY